MGIQRNFNRIAKVFFLKVGLWNIAQRLYYATLNRQKLAQIENEKLFYETLIHPGNLCFDIGANVGDKVNIFLSLGARVVACEPQPFCLDILNARFKGQKDFILVPKGVGIKEEVLTLYVHRENIGATSFLPDWQSDSAKIEDTIPIQITTLDHLIDKYGVPDYCKIDVEGFEINVLKGLSTPIRLLSFEYHLDHSEQEIQKTITCLEHISELTNNALKINVIPGSGKVNFLRQNWFSIDEFIPFFSNDLKLDDSFLFGDIFVICN
jgi:FkbM family methyltransferase